MLKYNFGECQIYYQLHSTVWRLAQWRVSLPAGRQGSTPVRNAVEAGQPVLNPPEADTKLQVCTRCTELAEVSTRPLPPTALGNGLN
ncbi:MAG: hypothetical protein JNN12_05655 [Bacteroidetes Order II. Incertae sedis bacterium]|nr:hypothetical protein [Bacteroidetes Order II. bacterium]